jgi:hypothetical protein
MMDLKTEGREVCIRLKDDVWVLEEPGTLCLSMEQAYYLRAHLNSLSAALLDVPEEDG